jgi:hypothetical protein
MKSRVLLVLATVPLSLVAAFFRLLFVLLAVYYIGCFMAGEPHVWISWAVFMIVLMFGIILDYYLTKWIKKD